MQNSFMLLNAVLCWTATAYIRTTHTRMYAQLFTHRTKFNVLQENIHICCVHTSCTQQQSKRKTYAGPEDRMKALANNTGQPKSYSIYFNLSLNYSREIEFLKLLNEKIISMAKIHFQVLRKIIEII